MRLRFHVGSARAALLASLLGALVLAAAAPRAVAADDLTGTTLDTPVQSPVWGQSVTFTATVRDTTNTATQPTGSVQFSVDGVARGEPVTLRSGTANFSTTLELGSHTVLAAFTSDEAFADSKADLTRTVGKAGVNVVATASPNPAVAGQDMTFVAAVTAAPPSTGGPIGKVAFFNSDGSPIGGPQDLSGGRAGISGWAAAGHYRIFAGYLGDDHFNASAGSVDVTVNKADTATTLTSSTTTVAPGQSVVLTALVGVTPPGDIGTFGSLQFTSNGTPIGSPIPLKGNAGVRVTLTAPQAPGTYVIGVAYTGDDNTNPSSASLPITVGPAGGGSARGGSAGGGSAVGPQQLKAVGATLMRALRKRGLAALSGTPEPFAAPAAGVLAQEVDSPNALKSAKAVRLATGRRAFNGPGSGVLKLRLTGAGRRAIRRGKALRVAIVTTFTPATGKPISVVQRLTVKAKKGAKTAAVDTGWWIAGLHRTGPAPAQAHGRI